MAQINRDRPLPAAQQPRVSDSNAQRAFDMLFEPLREVVRFLTPFVQREPWQLLVYSSTWSDSSTGRGRFRKDPLGFVRLDGLVARSGGALTTVGVLPEGYRPSTEQLRIVYAGGAAGVLTVSTAGVIDYLGAAGAVNIALSGIEFDTRTP